MGCDGANICQSVIPSQSINPSIHVLTGLPCNNHNKNHLGLAVQSSNERHIFSLMLVQAYEHWNAKRQPWLRGHQILIIVTSSYQSRGESCPIALPQLCVCGGKKEKRRVKRGHLQAREGYIDISTFLRIGSTASFYIKTIFNTE